MVTGHGWEVKKACEDTKTYVYMGGTAFVNTYDRYPAHASKV